MADAIPRSRRPDLGKRVASAVVMLAVAGSALWLGGWPLRIFVVLVGIGLLWEWNGLVARMTRTTGARTLWAAAGVVYIGAACASLIVIPSGLRWLIIAAVIATDTGAYFTGRHFGGPKIAPGISPSKTWSGLFGGMTSAALVVGGAWLLVTMAISALSGNNRESFLGMIAEHPGALLTSLVIGALIAVVAQAGDFFESWMKRRAGVKDSSTLIPGHGGLLDRVDGLLPVAILAGLFVWHRMS